MGGCTKCGVAYCKMSHYKARKANTDGFAIHAFPQQSDLYEKWVQFCQQDTEWEPSASHGICSYHFQKEDYGMEDSPAVQGKRRSRILLPSAIPSIFKSELHTSIESEEHVTNTCEESENCQDFYPMLQKICRICLNLSKENVLVPVDFQIQNTTVIDMLIQLTSFEAEQNDAYPPNICMDCIDQLERAWNTRQFFITQAEYLIQLVAEQNLVSYCEQMLVDSNETGSLEKSVESIIIDMHDYSRYGKSTNHESGIIGESKQQLDPIDNENHNSDLEPKAIQVDSEDVKGFESARLPLSEGGRKESRNRRTVRRTFQNVQSSKITKKRQNLEGDARKPNFPLTTCYICEQHHNTLLDLEQHLREHISMLPYQCAACVSPVGKEDRTANVEHPPLLKTSNQLNRHFMMHHMPHKCDKCYRRFSSTIKLKTHLWDSHGPGSSGLTCEYCGKQFFRRILFRKHISYHRKELSGQFSCSFCGRSLGSKESLRRHEISHTGEKKYKCLYCDKMFSTSYNRLTHQRSHTGELSHKCHACDRAFTDSSRLRMHLAWHHKLEPYAKYRSRYVRYKPPPLENSMQHCPYPDCDYTAKTYAAMYTHKRSKHMPKHQCEHCQKSFVYAHQLKNHMSLHTGEKPYQCELCERKFPLVDNYRRHMQTHKPDNSCTCTICKKNFKHPRYLRAHMLTHESIRKFACECCGNSYKSNGELKRHINNKHTVEINEERSKNFDKIEGYSELQYA